MNLTLVCSRKYRWPEHYFSVRSLGNSQKLPTTNQYLVSTIFCAITNISFFSLRFDLFSIITKKVNQIRNNVVCVVARLVFCCFDVHSLWAVAILFHTFSTIKRDRSFRAHISRLCYFSWLCSKSLYCKDMIKPYYIKGVKKQLFADVLQNVFENFAKFTGKHLC